MKNISTENKILIVVLILVLIAIGQPFIWKYVILSDKDFKDLGPVGDWFGGLTGPVIGLASVLLVYLAFRLQKDTFNLQQTQNTNQATTNTQQFLASSVQQFEASFFQLLSFHHKIIEGLKIKYQYKKTLIPNTNNNKDKKTTEEIGAFEESGMTDTQDEIAFDESMSRDFFETAYKILKEEYEEQKTKNKGQSKGLQENLSSKQGLLEENYNTFYKKHQASVGHYFRNLYHIVKYIHFTELITHDYKKRYIGILRAQLSSYELILLFYNSLINDLGYPKFNYLINHYDLLQNMNKDLLLDIDDFKIFENRINKVNPFEEKK